MLGFEGKWAIHPNQVQLAHRVFSPDEQLITRTRRIVDGDEGGRRATARARSRWTGG